jgi:ferredoxin-like protein FixX
MRVDGIFIGIEVDDDALASQPDLAKHLDTVCPVDIYKEVGDGDLEIVERNVDECVLCKLCLDLAALDVDDDAVHVIKLYDGGATLE